MVNYYCKQCDYNTSKKSDFSKHTKTKKHISNSSTNVPNITDAELIPNKVYMSETGAPQCTTMHQKKSYLCNFYSIEWFI